MAYLPLMAVTPSGPTGGVFSICVIAGVPVSDFSRIFWVHGPPQLIRDYLEMGINLEQLREIFRVVSPLAIEPKVAHERRAIYAGLGDRLVPIDQVADLWRHWDQPNTAWYNGSGIRA